MQIGIPHFTYQTHKVLCPIQRRSHIGNWYVATPPPDLLIYIIVYTTMLRIYIGKTSLAPAQRLRKHQTDAMANKKKQMLCHIRG